MTEEKSSFISEVDRLGFIISPSLVLFDTRISDAAFRLYNILKWYARNENQCFPGIDKLCLNFGKGSRSTYRALRELQDVGLISIESNYSKANVYNINPISDVYCIKSSSKILSDDTLTSCNLRRVCGDSLNSFKIVFDTPDGEDKNVEENKEKPKENRVLNIKSAAAAAKEKYSNITRRNREKAMMQSSGKTSNETDKTITRELGILWFELWDKQFSDIPCLKWTPKEKNVVKHLITKLGRDDLLKLTKYVFENWDDLQIRFKLDKSHAPTLGLISAYSDSWIQEVYRGKSNLKNGIANRGEFREDDSPDVGWGK